MTRDRNPDVALWYAMARERLQRARFALEMSGPEWDAEHAIWLASAVTHLMTAHFDREEARALRRKRVAA